MEKKKISPYQFTLRNLFAWMTALAIILGLLRSLVLLGIEFPELDNFIWQMSIVGVMNALPPLSALWAVNGKNYPTLRGIQLLIVFGGIGFFILSAPDKETMFYITTMFTLELLLLVGSLMVFRLEGFRLVRLRQASASSPKTIGEFRENSGEFRGHNT